MYPDILTNFIDQCSNSCKFCFKFSEQFQVDIYDCCRRGGRSCQDTWRGSSEENEFHICVRVCCVEGRGKSLSGQFFFVCEKHDREESSMKSLGGMMWPKDEKGSQIVSSESDISHPIPVYLSRNNNFQAQARRIPALTAPEQSFLAPSEIRWRVCGAREAPAPRDSLNFRRASLLSRNEFESRTFTIVLHATSFFTYVSVIYGANFPLTCPQNLQSGSVTASDFGADSICPERARSAGSRTALAPLRG